MTLYLVDPLRVVHELVDLKSTLLGSSPEEQKSLDRNIKRLRKVLPSDPDLADGVSTFDVERLLEFLDELAEGEYGFREVLTIRILQGFIERFWGAVDDKSEFFLQAEQGSQNSSSDVAGEGSIDAEEVDGETGLSDVDANDTSPMRRRFVFQKKWKEEHPDYNPERYQRHAKEMRAAYAVDNPNDADATARDFANARQKYKNL